MRNAKSNKTLEELIGIVDSEGIQTGKLIKPLQEIREIAKQEKDPLVTRALRLAWQHLEANESFNIPLAEEIETFYARKHRCYPCHYWAQSLSY